MSQTLFQSSSRIRCLVRSEFLLPSGQWLNSYYATKKMGGNGGITSMGELGVVEYVN